MPIFGYYDKLKTYLAETEDPELELKVTVININVGYNKELMEKCRTLKEYSLYVERIRKHAAGMPIEEAVRRSVDECIREGILADFLKAQKAEVIAMSIFEYNEETELKKIREDEYDMGLEDGKKMGIQALVEICRELKVSKEETIHRVTEKFAVPEEVAKELAEEFWQEL